MYNISHSVHVAWYVERSIVNDFFGCVERALENVHLILIQLTLIYFLIFIDNATEKLLFNRLLSALCLQDNKTNEYLR